MAINQLLQYALTNMDDVKAFMSVEYDKVEFENDNLIIALINRVSKKFENYCGRNFVSREYTEYYDGGGKAMLYTSQYPIISVTELNDDVSWNWTESTKIDSDNYRIANGAGAIMLKNFRFADYMENVKVVYNAGYDEIPEDLVDACIQEVARLLNIRRDVHVYSKTLDDGSVERYQADFLPTTKQVLDNYKNYGII